MALLCNVRLGWLMAQCMGGVHVCLNAIDSVAGSVCLLCLFIGYVMHICMYPVSLCECGEDCVSNAVQWKIKKL